VRQVGYLPELQFSLCLLMLQLLSQLHGLYTSNGKITVFDPFGPILHNKILVNCLKAQSQNLPEVTAEDHKHHLSKIPVDSRMRASGTRIRTYYQPNRESEENGALLSFRKGPVFFLVVSKHVHILLALLASYV
jgi:hypothetical protein